MSKIDGVSTNIQSVGYETGSRNVSAAGKESFSSYLAKKTDLDDLAGASGQLEERGETGAEGLCGSGQSDFSL